MQAKSFFYSVYRDVLDLFYPRLCAACDDVLAADEGFICLNCRFSLPETGFHNEQYHELEKVFWGRVNIKYALAFYFFRKSSKVQHLLHNIKYKEQKEAAVEAGRWYGSQLLQDGFSFDCIVPVPLHERKLRARGFNQSAFFGQGMAEGLAIPMDTDSVMRAIFNPTQTKKSRYARWKNVEDIFRLQPGHELDNKHVLLVDDVVTTGSTLEACARAVLRANGAKVSIATLAYAG
ncbi:MAG: phosphoribosyltransferase family protein [Bacteroidia bacterium]